MLTKQIAKREYKLGYEYGLRDLFKTSDTEEYNSGCEDGQNSRKKAVAQSVDLDKSLRYEDIGV